MGASEKVSESVARRTYLAFARASTANSSGGDRQQGLWATDQQGGADQLGPLPPHAEDRPQTSSQGIRRTFSAPRPSQSEMPGADPSRAPQHASRTTSLPQQEAETSGRGLSSRTGKRGALLEGLISGGAYTAEAKRALEQEQASAGAREAGPTAGPPDAGVPWDQGYRAHHAGPPPTPQSRGRGSGDLADGRSRPVTSGTDQSTVSSYVWEKQLLEVAAGSIPRGTVRKPLRGEVERTGISSPSRKGAHGQWTSPRRRRLMRDIDQLGAAMLVGKLGEVNWDSPL